MRSFHVKTVRFTNVVKRAGAPEPHLVWSKSEQDPDLKKAIQQHRVMTVFQNAVGHKADHGQVGFEPGANRQFLIFPKSLRAFEGHNVVGIRYDELQETEIPQSERHTPPRHPQKSRKKPAARKSRRLQPVKESEPAEEEIPRRSPDKSDREGQSDSAIKRRVRRAMRLLEQGKAVAAFNLLKAIVED